MKSPLLMQGLISMSMDLQKAGIWKRFSAYLFDLMLVVFVTVAGAILFASMFRFDASVKEFAEITVEYEDKYGIDLDISQEDYNALSEAEKAAYDETYKIALEEYSKDGRVSATYGAIVSKTLLIVALSLLFGVAIVHFLFPLLFKNGQTLGKKIFGLAVTRTNFVRLKSPILFARSILGVYAIETMFPAFLIIMILLGKLGIIGVITLLLFLVLQIGVMIYTPTNSSIHDLLADTVVVDMASQQIFETEVERLEYVQAEAARKAAETDGAYNR